MPPDEKKTAAWKWAVGYGAFFIASLFFGLYVTFPYDALKARVQQEASNAGFFVRMDSLGPGLFGVTARELRISKKLEGNSDTPPPSLELDSFAVRPAMFPPGVAFRAGGFGGTVTGAVGVVGDLKLRLHLNDLLLNKGNLKAFTGVDLSGQVNGDLSLNIPQVLPPGGKVKEPDITKAAGDLSLDVDGLAVNGGTINIPMGGETIPQDLPKIMAGTVDVKMPIKDGLATADKFHIKGSDLELFISGTLKLARRLENSEPNLDLKVKPDPEWQKRIGPTGAALSFLPADKTDPSFRAVRMTGYLARPSFPGMPGFR